STSYHIFARSDFVVSFLWSGTRIVLSSFPTRRSSDLAGTYSVVATNPVNGCTASASIVVTQNNTPPSLALTNAPALNCLTTTAQIFAASDSAVAFFWTGIRIVGSHTGNSITVNAAGTY